jgi:hypothetical protein
MSSKRYLRHVKRPEWGIGLVVREHGDKLDIRFEHAGEKSLVPNPAMLEDVDEKTVPKDSPLRKKPEKVKPKPLVDDPLPEENHDVLLRAVSLLLRDRLRRAFPPEASGDDTEDDDAAIAGTAVTRWLEDLSAFVGVPYWRVKKASFASAKKLAERAGGAKLAGSLVARISANDRAAETSTLLTRADAIEFARDVLGVVKTAKDELEEVERETLDDAIPWDTLRASRERWREQGEGFDDG